jgi:hypothetical protein
MDGAKPSREGEATSVQCDEELHDVTGLPHHPTWVCS